eukprot:TRINITY_DN4693_c0_g1_i1.p1 TRINITY_DN4693_c0_g1~~TRINITY_DN4693_c0_g1_i1.p1  ORF type:complete len:204 (+),score=56.53 TRINITY_DN4693_c0_g1_i1:45-656(+)
MDEVEMEIEALKAIYMDDYQEIAHPQIFSIKLRSESDPNAWIIMEVQLTPKYPEEVPILLFTSSKGYTESLNELSSISQKLAEESVGMAMAFTLASRVKDWIEEYEVNQKELKKREEEELAESQKPKKRIERPEHVDGTPVTVESFNAWKARFLLETDPATSDSKTVRLNGRQLFEGDISLALSDVNVDLFVSEDGDDLDIDL